MQNQMEKKARRYEYIVRKVSQVEEKKSDLETIILGSSAA